MLRLRPFSAVDADRIISWSGDETAFRRWSADIYKSYPITGADMIGFYETAARGGMFFPYTAVEDEDMVGHLIIRFPKDRSTARFGFVIVDPVRRGQGIGRQMMELAKKEAAERFGARFATLGVFADNVPALRCYLSAGFREVKTDKQEYYRIFEEEWLCIEMSTVL
ncbi:MAG: GNAT family N-acetyltransferase [Oscillospiraceae bacterium]|nr:GNAT family N-acetyltransferase [Oscillospiraceae bacterium]